MTYLRRLLAVPLATVDRFYADHCLVRASALAYASLLSIVPLLAVMFSVLKGLGVQWRLEPILLSRLSLNPDTIHEIIQYIDRTNVSTLGALGAAMLIFSVISVLGSIESSFNVIWRVSRDRTVWRKVTDYVSVIMLTPFLMLAAVAITSSLRAHRLLELVTNTELVGTAVIRVLQVAPSLINALAIGVLYAVMPNRRPAIGPLVVSALFAGVAWSLVQWGYVTLQIGAANYNAIYGALSQLPVTLVWLYLSWVIVLAGAELAAVLEFGSDHIVARTWNAAALSLHVLIRAAENFSGMGKPLTVGRLAQETHVDIDSMRDAVAELERVGWLASIDGDQSRYILSRDPAQIDLSRLGAVASVGTVPRGCDRRVGCVLESIATSSEQAWGRWRLSDVLDAARADKPHVS